MGKKKDSFDDISSILLGDRDRDNDDVENFNDCQPLNPKKQDLKGAFKSFASKVKDYGTTVGKRVSRAVRGNEVWVTSNGSEWWVWKGMPHHATRLGEYPGRVGVYKSRKAAVRKARSLIEKPGILHIEGKEIFVD